MTPPPDNIPPPQNQETQTQSQTQIRKTNSTRPAVAQEQGIKCPRCDSPNTKFCYYNNYSLTQPRHFCKTCRRYWTNGGALRNVPIGGGCRKNKRQKSSSSSSSSSMSSSSRTLSCDPKDFQLQGLTIPPSLDFSLGGLNFQNHLPSPITAGVFNLNQFSSFGNVNVNVPSSNALCDFQLDPTAASNSLMGLVPPNTELWSVNPLNSAMQSMNVHGNLTSSIQTLSNMNQELHMNMQQQRLSMIFGGPSQNGGGSSSGSGSGSGSGVTPVAAVNGFENHKVQQQQQQPVLFHHNLEMSNSENLPRGSSVTEGPNGGGDTLTSTEWFFGNPYSSSLTTPASTTASNHANVNVNDVNNNWGGNAALPWGDFQHQPFSALP